ncbi:MAG: triple tyrosine motif-containing protein, partial [Bacteroidota bacterium]
MYFIRIFSKNTIFFSILLSIFFIIYQKLAIGDESGSPYIQQILLDNFGYSNNNFSIIQDQHGILYISNSNGILQYDGSYWELIELPGIAKLTINKNNNIYVGFYNDFGILQPDHTKQLNFISLLDTTNISQKNIGQIEKVISYNDDIYFCTKKSLYKFNGQDINIIDSSSVSLDIFYAENQLFLKKSGYGLQKMINHQFRTVPNYSFFNDKNIYAILPYNQQLLAKTDKGFYLFDNFMVTAFETDVNELIDENVFSSASLLKDGSYAFGTRLDGIFIMDKTGKLIKHINESSGLFSISVNELFADGSNNLWALHDQGISRIEYPSGYSYFNKNNGLQGNVTSVIRFKNTLYVATSLGVFYLSNEKNNEKCIGCAVFKPVPGIKSNCYKLHKINGQLFVTTAKGIYEIVDKKSILFYNREAEDIAGVLHSKKHPSYIFIGHNNGISALKYEQGILIIRKRLEGINEKISSIAEEKDGTLWFASRHSGVYKIEPFNDYSSKLPFTHFSKDQIFTRDINWINLYSVHNGMLFSTSEGLFRYDQKKNKFYKDTIIGIDLKKETQWVYPIVEDNQKNLWLNIIGKGYARNKTLVKWFNKDSLRILKPLPLNRMKDFFVTSIHPENSGIVWFGGYEGLVRLDLNYQSEKTTSFNTYLHKIVSGSDSIIYQLPYSTKSLAGNLASGDLDIPEFDYRFNRFYFEFTANDYASEDQLQFQYKLEGFDTTWSKWSAVSFKEYTNLFEGKYTFRVRAKNIFDEIAQENQYQFIIRPPFYRTTIAYFIYLVAIVFLILLMIKWRSYYYAKERFKLE